MTMLEKAARAAFESHAWGDVGPEEAPHTWENLPEEWRDVYRKMGRAFLGAVREMPAETQAAIFNARDGFVHEIDIPAVWEMGVDAILNEGRKTNG